jgi:uncharacterized protein YndB with AHSA1/START domain
MEIDIAKQIGAVAREVASRDYEGKPARVVVASQTYSTTAEDLFEAITTAERIPRWFMPITGDLRLGGRYQLQGNAGGEILICEPPTHLRVTWEYGGETSWLEVWIEAVSPKSARLTLEHGRLRERRTLEPVSGRARSAPDGILPWSASRCTSRRARRRLPRQAWPG